MAKTATKDGPPGIRVVYGARHLGFPLWASRVVTLPRPGLVRPVALGLRPDMVAIAAIDAGSGLNVTSCPVSVTAVHWLFDGHATLTSEPGALSGGEGMGLGIVSTHKGVGVPSEVGSNVTS